MVLLRVVQSWDDGVVDDIRLTEILRYYGATATFNLNPGLHQSERTHSFDYGEKAVWRLGTTEWRAVYAGFEIANHSLTHPYLPDLSPDNLWREVYDARRKLQDVFQQPVRGFCYPFGGRSSAVKQVVRDTGHIYARTVASGEPTFPPPDPLECGVHCHFTDPAFWDRYERAKVTSGFFFFWGHSYELVSEDLWADLEHKIAGITHDPAAQWCHLEGLF